MFEATINAETVTPQGKVISTFYRHTVVGSLGDAHVWVKRITRAFVRSTRAYVTIRDNTTFETVTHYRWEYTGGSRYCPGRRLRRY